MLRRHLPYALAGIAIPGPARADPSETTFDRIRRTKTVRIGAVGGQAP